ncbi:hypothetical protein [Nocardioides sp. Kera G14]|uniref:8-oxoguanine DNA glycosylase OGG fold protein n=1 Tax=Nocardioides sp. Kera G14 TaxID=2884264 RepID=UPI001D0FA24B|nr:hypothetical protein [Nocardioides sp. Kera G14]UDY22476.1 hypothetical protein LH076_10325 [Nocardioides sp. Kera G14]
MIDNEVLTDVRIAAELARTTVLAGGVLDGLAWTVDPSAGVELHPSWRAEPRLPGHVRTTLSISRSDLASVAADCRHSGAWIPLLVAVNAWSYGASGYGAWRTARTAALPDAEIRLSAAVATLDVHGPVEAYYQLNNEGHLHGWGPSYFTRFLHAADQREHGRAIAIDASLADAVNALVPGSDLGPADWGTAEYAFHLGLVHRIAGEAGVDAAVVEAVLGAKFSG